MSIMVPIALFGWLPAVVLIFWLWPGRRAVLIAYLLAWLFLPMAGYKVQGLTEYTKMTATSLGVLLGVLLFDNARLLAFRPRWIDLPIVVWCVCPFASSISNGLGAYDGCSAAAYQAITWGLPYLIGRLYFADLEGLRELAMGTFIGGLIYVPLCLYEIKMSPQLHRIVYGFLQHDWVQTKRFGGWRPMVFMQHGLMVGMWMTAASLVGVWLWETGALRRLRGVPTGWPLLALLVTTAMCRSAGALSLLISGLGALYLVKWTRSSWPVWCLVAAAPLYMGLRATRIWSGEGLVSLTRQWINAERAESLQFRLTNEDQLAAKALHRPVFGWGGWGRGRVYDDDGRDVSVTDGLWIIALGGRGIVGLGSLTAALLLPVGVMLWRRPAGYWAHPAFAPVAALAVMLALYMIDNIPNGMVNPIFVLVMGGVAALAASNRTWQGSRHPAVANCERRSFSRNSMGVGTDGAIGEIVGSSVVNGRDSGEL